MSGGPQNGSLNRRAVLGLAALTVAGLGAMRAGLFSKLLPTTNFDFRDLTDPPGFRRIPGGQITGSNVALIGLDRQKSAATMQAELQVSNDLCAALFRARESAKDVPVAYFYDYQCPICRRLSPTLLGLDGISLTWHDLAGLGPASELAARAAIAARAQGAFEQFHSRLMRARFQATEGYVASLAQTVGIDAQRLIADMNSVDITQKMLLSRAVAKRFGMVGTPGMVVGRTVVIGNISTADLNTLLELERTAPTNWC